MRSRLVLVPVENIGGRSFVRREASFGVGGDDDDDDGRGCRLLGGEGVRGGE